MGDDAEQYVVGWSERGSAVHKLAIVSPAGAFLASPVDVPRARHLLGNRTCASF